MRPQRTPLVIIDPMKCSALPRASVLAARFPGLSQSASIFDSNRGAGAHFRLHKPALPPLKWRTESFWLIYYYIHVAGGIATEKLEVLHV